MRTGNRLTVHLKLSRDGGEHLPRQLTGQLVGAIRSGVLAPGARLPSTRDLAGLLGVSRGVVLAAYELLLAEGFVEGRPGSGTYVRTTGTDRPVRRTRTGLPGPLADASAPRWLPAVAFPLAAWRAAWRGASYQPPAGEPGPLGSAVLRHAVAEHLRRVRGVPVEADDVVVTDGIRQACWLLFEAVGQTVGGAPVVAVEQPAAPYPALAVRQAGGRAVALPVDTEGARVDLLTDDVRCAVVSAEGNQPLGTALSADRRRDLLAWTGRVGRYVADVCDERSGVAAGLPLPPLAGERVALIGTIGDTLAGPGVSYLVPPRHLLPLVGALAGHDDGRPGATVQAAYTRLLRDGTVAARTERTARVCARRREQVRAFAGTLPRPARMVVGSRGAWATLMLPQPAAAAVRTELGAHGVRTTALADLYQIAAADAAGLVLDLGRGTDEQFEDALQTIRAVVTRRFGRPAVTALPVRRLAPLERCAA